MASCRLASPKVFKYYKTQVVLSPTTLGIANEFREILESSHELDLRDLHDVSPLFYYPYFYQRRQHAGL